MTAEAGIHQDHYFRRARVVDVYDGDTVRCDVDLGYGIWTFRQQIRLLGIDTPELRGASYEAGIAARDYLRFLVLDKDVVLQTHKDTVGKYGRWLGVLWIDGANVNMTMFDQGFATEYLK